MDRASFRFDPGSAKKLGIGAVIVELAPATLHSCFINT